MKAITPIISVIVILLIAIALAGSGWLFISSQYKAYVSKPIKVVHETSFCSSGAAGILVQNIGTEGISLPGPPVMDFGRIGNMIPNSGFEEIDQYERPVYWVHETAPGDIDVALVTDLSNSMTDCMDNGTITPDMDTILLMHMDDNIEIEDSSGMGNHGSVLGYLNCSLPGRFGYGCGFDGDGNYVDARSPLNPSSGSFSFSVWVNFKDLLGPAEQLIGNGGSGNGWILYRDGNDIIFHIPDSSWVGVGSSYLDSYSNLGQYGHTITRALDGTNYWYYAGGSGKAWFVIDIGQSYTFHKARGRSLSVQDPTNVAIYVSEDGSTWGTAVATGINTWQDTSSWQEVNLTEKNGRYVNFTMVSGEHPNDFKWGGDSYFKIVDLYGEPASASRVNASWTAADQWVHIAGTFDNSTKNASIYLDGVLKDSKILDNGYSDSSDSLIIGTNAGGDNLRDFNGSIDEVMVFNRPLTPQEIQDLYNGGEAGPDSDTVLLMHMNNGGEFGMARDSSGNENHGTLNDISSDPEGKYGRAFDFDGSNDYIDLGNLDIVGGVLTIEAWFRADSISGCGPRIVSKATGSCEQCHWWMLSLCDGKLRFRLKTGGTTTTLIAGSGTISSGVWTHATAVYDGSSMTLYKDGVEVGRTGKTGTISTDSSVSAWIGSNPPDNYYPFDGLIDEVAVYTRALTPEEIKSHADALTGKECAVLEPDGDTVLWMDMEDSVRGAGQTITDSSGQGNDGTIFGNADCTVPGRFGLGCYFDGNGDYIDSGDIDVTGDITVSLWVNSPKRMGYQSPASEYAWDAGWYIREDGVYPGHWQFYVAGRGTATDPASIARNQWVHLAGVNNGTNILLYKDGVLVKSAASSGPTQSTWQNLLIGTGAGNYFNGTIDNVRIWNRSLTGDEIKSLAGKCSDCPDDGRGDMPSRCRYETSLCPLQRPDDEEAYAPESWEGVSYQAPAFRRVAYSLIPGSGPSQSCTLEPGCSSAVCGGMGRFYNGSTIYGPDVVMDSCGANECENGYVYSGCGWYPRTNQYQSVCSSLGIPYDAGDRMDTDVCRSGCEPGERNYGACSCSWYDRAQCGTSVCSSLGFPYDSGDDSVTVWKTTPCNTPQECDTGERRHTTYRCEEGSCAAGYSECGDCSPSCEGFETCCCLDSSLEYKCVQERDECCSSRRCVTYSDRCCNVRQVNCRTVEHWCCEPTDTCAPDLPGEDTDPCTPGFVGGYPDPLNNCNGGVWQCRADGGSCYICGSVAIRLAKKLDMGFVDDVFSAMSAGSRMGLVSYGGDMSATGLTNDRAAIGQEVGSYHADRGETCIACAISGAASMLTQDNPGSRKYMVLMSDGDANVRDNSASSDRNGDGGIDAKDDAIARACQAGSQGIIIYAVGFGREAGEDTLERIKDCGAEGSRFFRGSSPESLEAIYQQIARELSEASTSAEKVYGERSMSIDASGAVHVASSGEFDVYIGQNENYTLSFYGRLRIDSGAFRAKMKFFDGAGTPLGGDPGDENWITLQTYGPGTGENFVHHALNISGISETAATAAVFFGFDDGSAGTALIDDLYFGPEVRCTREGGFYQCGDIRISKTGSGDLYPYFGGESLNPGQTMVLKDGNCRGYCTYKVASPTNAMEVYVNCG